MPYTPVVNDILEARFITFNPTLPAQIGVNVVHYRVSIVTGTGQTLTQMAASLDAVVAPLYKNVISSTCSYRGMQLQRAFPKPRTFQEFSNASAGTGSGAATQTPTQVTGVIKVTTAKAGRPFRGRIYVGFLGTGSIAGTGNPTAAYVTALQALGNAIFPSSYGVLSGGNGFTMVPCVFHAKGYGKPPANIATVDDITAVVASSLAGTQRRRGNYGRSNPSSPI